MRKTILCLFAVLNLINVMAENINIILNENASSIEQKAASELIQHLTLKNDKVWLKKEGEPVIGKKIYLGNTNYARNKKLDFTLLENEEWLLKTYDTKTLVIGGGAPRGVLYATWEFLERMAGVMWLDEYNTFIPSLESLELKDNFELRGKPSFQWRQIYVGDCLSDNEKTRVAFACRNRLNYFASSPRGIKDYGITRALYGSPRNCHTFYHYTKAWGEDKNELFSLWRGQRRRATSPGGSGQICFTSKEARRLIIEQLREFIKKDREGKGTEEYPLIYDISANDCEYECECENCLLAIKTLGNYSDLMLDFINEIARGVSRDYPEVKIQTFAYMFTQNPPLNIKAEKNVLIRIAQLGSEAQNQIRDTLRPLSHANNVTCFNQLKEWKKFAHLSLWDYWITFRNTGFAAVNTDTIMKNLKLYHQLEIDTLFVECERPLETAFHALRIWLGCRLMNDISLDATQEIERFMHAYYGSAALYMKRYKKLLEKTNGTLEEHLSIPMRSRTDLSPDFFLKANDILSGAENEVRDSPLLLQNVLRERICLDAAQLEKIKPDRRKNIEDYQRVSKRFLENFAWLAPRLTSLKKAQKMISTMESRYSADIPHLNDFENRIVLSDYFHADLDRVSSRLNTEIIDDDNATGGKAMVLREANHDRPLKFGFYDATKRQGVSFEISSKELPQDESYHFYSIGNVVLGENCFVWLHWSWYMQKSLSELFTPNVNAPENEAEIILSIKAQGPAYVKNSSKSNAVFLDRVIVLKPLTPKRFASLEREDFIEVKTVRNSTTSGMYVNDSEANFSSAIAEKVQSETFRVSIYDWESKKVVDALQLPVKELSGQYQLYRFPRPVQLTPRTSVVAGSWKINARIGEYCNNDNPTSLQRKWNVYISLKYDHEQKEIRCDGVYLVDAEAEQRKLPGGNIPYPLAGIDPDNIRFIAPKRDAGTNKYFVHDPDAVNGSAVAEDASGTIFKFQCYDFGTRNSVAVTNLKIDDLSDGYHLYKLSDSVIPMPRMFVVGGKWHMSIPLGLLAADAAEGKTVAYDVYLSLKYNREAGKILCDGAYLVRKQ